MKEYEASVNAETPSETAKPAKEKIGSTLVICPFCSTPKEPYVGCHGCQAMQDALKSPPSSEEKEKVKPMPEPECWHQFELVSGYPDGHRARCVRCGFATVFDYWPYGIGKDSPGK